MGDGRGAQPWACIYTALQKNVDANGARLVPCHNLDSSTKKMMDEKKSEKKLTGSGYGEEGCESRSTSNCVVD